MVDLLRVEQLRIAYPTPYGEKVWAVDGVSFRIDAGERLGFVGESGCGKSTLGRAMLRLLPPTAQIEGDIFLEGRSIFELDRSQLQRFRGEAIALVFQDPMTRLDPLMTIGDHCLETLQAHRPQLSNKQAKAKSLEVLEAVRIPAARWGQYPHEFSGGMRQRVAIALALLLEPKLIIADEPTTSLDVTVSAEILRELTRLCQERNLGLMLISHDLALVAEYCDRVAVMYQGEMVETGPARDILTQPQHAYTQSLLEAALHIQALQTPEPEPETAPVPLLRVSHLKQHYSLESSLLQQWFSGKTAPVIKAVDDVSFELYQGEVLGLVGESGCGKSTLSRTILQLVRPTAGMVELNGQDITQLAPRELRPLRRQMQMIFQDPLACLNPLMTVGQSIADPLLIHGLAQGDAVQAQVAAILARVGLTPVADYMDRFPRELSGGQQQRVAIARALITQPQLLICDEPVSMLDATVQSQVLDLMRDLQGEFNLTYLFITHDLWVARFLCDRIAVMQGGKIVEMGPTEELFTNPQHPYTRTLLGAAPLLSQFA
ncbi:ABC transporter ATP-binding protein [Spirulina sp. CCNP1310]|uniref:ABC transporter ATP-binding protein n=1 Tax=Spirulina sp. CCNP1310 TaxID=3110249 RepID=UPI002B21C669|nr:ABC transporter ATP-binding protein [Spirulina sp. CCNP1310]MEA5418297.1 ABC transporter ATP-binding protein [Spirulina sp. CCNP1310]